jgi:hypothetical protein
MQEGKESDLIVEFVVRKRQDGSPTDRKRDGVTVAVAQSKADTRDSRIWVNLTMGGDDLVSPKGIKTQHRSTRGKDMVDLLLTSTTSGGW